MSSSLAEIAANAHTLLDYERAALELVGGTSVSTLRCSNAAGGCGPYTPGLDPAIKRACEPYWHEFAREVTLVGKVALRQRGVAVDVEVFGMRGSNACRTTSD